jgi:hypothetical protein
MAQARRSFVIAFTGASSYGSFAVAQAYPSRPITIIVHPPLGLSGPFARSSAVNSGRLGTACGGGSASAPAASSGRRLSPTQPLMATRC